jgi:hypothetical protein
MVLTPCVGVGAGVEMGKGVGVGEGVGDDEGGVLGVGVDVELAVGEEVPVGEGVLLGEGVGDDEDELLGVGVGVELGEGEGDPPSVPEGSLLDKFIPDMTYTTRNNSKQTHTMRKIKFLLPIFHFH